MAIDQKPNREEKLPPLELRDNAKVKAKIEAHKKAHPEDTVFFTRLVKEHPDRAVDTLILHKADRAENNIRNAAKQLAQAKAFYDAQPPEAKAQIDRELQRIGPYYEERAQAAPEVRRRQEAGAKPAAPRVAA
jgi:hypothetical protein